MADHHLATASHRRRPGRSTSAGRARRCTTGRSPVRAVARSCCGSRTPTRPGTVRSGRRESSTRSPGSASRPTTRTSRARISRAPTPRAHVAAAQRLFDEGVAYYCDLTADEIQARAKELGLSGYDGYSRDRGLEPGAGPGAALPGAGGHDDRARSGARRGALRELDDRGLRAAARQRHADVPARQRRRRHRDGYHRTSCAPRNTSRTRRSSRCCGARSATSHRRGATCRCS